MFAVLNGPGAVRPVLHGEVAVSSRSPHMGPTRQAFNNDLLMLRVTSLVVEPRVSFAARLLIKPAAQHCRWQARRCDFPINPKWSDEHV